MRVADGALHTLLINAPAGIFDHPHSPIGALLANSTLSSQHHEEFRVGFALESRSCRIFLADH